ncbi:MAG: phosphoribosylglycinamide formyltransferase [Capsulimonas sp.]|uniref:phosphoribosylglycinamide formyltransferase n=1 Tax=Capsulimonas sp. TaxID=2494211 RepID=UPI0032666776
MIVSSLFVVNGIGARPVPPQDNPYPASNYVRAMSLRIAILVSGRHGRGSNMQAIVDACHDGRIDGQIVTVIGNFASSPALHRAAGIGLRTATVPSPKGSSEEDERIYSDALLQELRAADAELVCLAGYVRKLPTEVVSAFPGRVMNIHNALLPSFGGKGMYGSHVHQAVIDYGVKFSGCTVHFVDENYDSGPIILQETVPVEDDDTPETLAARVLVAEHRSYPRAVALFAAGKLRIEGRRVFTAA